MIEDAKERENRVTQKEYFEIAYVFDSLTEREQINIIDSIKGLLSERQLPVAFQEKSN